jgi:hypothetical protein
VIHPLKPTPSLQSHRRNPAPAPNRSRSRNRRSRSPKYALTRKNEAARLKFRQRMQRPSIEMEMYRGSGASNLRRVDVLAVQSDGIARADNDLRALIDRSLLHAVHCVEAVQFLPSDAGDDCPSVVAVRWAHSECDNGIACVHRISPVRSDRKAARLRDPYELAMFAARSTSRVSLSTCSRRLRDTPTPRNLCCRQR